MDLFQVVLKGWAKDYIVCRLGARGHGSWPRYSLRDGRDIGSSRCWLTGDYLGYKSVKSSLDAGNSSVCLFEDG